MYLASSLNYYDMFSPTGDIDVCFFLSHFCAATTGSTLARDMTAHFILGDCDIDTAGYSPIWDTAAHFESLLGCSLACDMAAN